MEHKKRPREWRGSPKGLLLIHLTNINSQTLAKKKNNHFEGNYHVTKKAKPVITEDKTSDYLAFFTLDELLNFD